MKIEIGESLVYSWLRHVKTCQIVQNNWKVSPYWPSLTNENDLEILMEKVKEEFDKDGYDVFKNNANLTQFISQGECDALGIDTVSNTYYGVDVAFHRLGVNYGSRNKTVAKIIEKCIRTAMCLYGYMNCKDAKIYFISPKIGKKITVELEQCIDKLQDITDSLKYEFQFCILANADFKSQVLDGVTLSSDDVDDTAELFLRSYQLMEMFSEKKSAAKTSTSAPKTSYGAFKIGQLANVVLRTLLENGKATAAEVTSMLDVNYSKQVFDLQYPVLTKKRDASNAIRYYAFPLKIKGDEYYLCSQWFETSANNDRPSLEKWIEEHR